MKKSDGFGYKCLQNFSFFENLPPFFRLNSMRKKTTPAPKGKFAQLTLEDVKPEQFVESLFDRLFEIARISNFTSEEVSEYEASLMTRWDYNASMKFAKEEGVAIGEARGIALGRNEGVAIGEARGIAVGREEGLQQAALQMKAKGFNIAVICEITGLSEAEVEGL